MFYSIFPDKDATMYEVSESLNTGLDEILELSNFVTDNAGALVAYNSRILLKFNVTNISESMSGASPEISSEAKFYLRLSTTKAEEIPISYSLETYPVSESWEMGTGRYYNFPKTTDGVSWAFRDGKTADSTWTSASADFATDTTGGSVAVNGGGTWWTAMGSAQQEFSYSETDVNMDVTTIVKNWMTGSAGTKIDNDGFIVKIVELDEQSTSSGSQGTIQFFSRDTHTIYPPRLDVAWDDSAFSAGSLSELTASEKVVYFRGMKNEYPTGSRVRFRLRGRERFPQKSYVATASYTTNNYFLPTSSYYSIKDAHTEETAVEFDDAYTKISCDSDGNYFDIWMDGLQPERYYRFVLKVKQNTLIEYFDNDFLFKVVR